ncbi:single-stranded DNA-binding protein [Escherichia coli O111:NM str. K6890]|nr:single-stranded DNA-binding protein [Escherichia coli O111:NM str. K6890]
MQSGITTKAFCGVLAILPVAAEGRQYPSSANTLNNSKHLVRWKTAPYIPALKDGVLRHTG